MSVDTALANHGIRIILELIYPKVDADTSVARVNEAAQKELYFGYFIQFNKHAIGRRW